MARTEAEISSIVNKLIPCFQLEDQCFVGIERQIHFLSVAHFFVKLNSNGDVLIKIPLPECVTQMIRLTDGRFALAGKQALLVCDVDGKVQHRMRVPSQGGVSQPACFPELCPLINGNMLLSQRIDMRRPDGPRYGVMFSEYTPEGECVDTHEMPQYAQPHDAGHTPLMQLDNGNIVMVYYDTQRNGRNPHIAWTHDHALLDEGVFIKIFMPDFQTEVATLTLRDNHTAYVSRYPFPSRQLMAKTCIPADEEEHQLAIAFVANETNHRLQINIYELGTYHQVASLRPDASIAPCFDNGGLLQTNLTDFNFSESLKHDGYTPSHSVRSVGPLW